jgi:hypothetical protein
VNSLSPEALGTPYADPHGPRVGYRIDAPGRGEIGPDPRHHTGARIALATSAVPAVVLVVTVVDRQPRRPPFANARLSLRAFSPTPRRRRLT